MKIIGLTGGSGVGKSTVSRLLTARGAGAVDADAVYRELCETSAPMLSALRQAFGDTVLENGALCRPALARIVFSSPERLRTLNAITTPYIRAASLAAIEALSHCPVVLYDAPTLFETGADALCEDVIGVLANKEIRVRRVIQRDGLSEAAARARIDAQPDDDFYRLRCRYLIENNDGLPSLEHAADIVYETLIGG